MARGKFYFSRNAVSMKRCLHCNYLFVQVIDAGHMVDLIATVANDRSIVVEAESPWFDNRDPDQVYVFKKAKAGEDRWDISSDWQTWELCPELGPPYPDRCVDSLPCMFCGKNVQMMDGEPAYFAVCTDCVAPDGFLTVND